MVLDIWNLSEKDIEKVERADMLDDDSYKEIAYLKPYNIGKIWKNASKKDRLALLFLSSAKEFRKNCPVVLDRMFLRLLVEPELKNAELAKIFAIRESKIEDLCEKAEKVSKYDPFLLYVLKKSGRKV
jgi:hypothetical protein